MVRDRLIWSDLPIRENQCQPASLDLRLGETASRVQCSFLPGKDAVSTKLAHYTLHTLNLTQGAVLDPGCVYIIPLRENLTLPKGVRAKANPRSTTGRLDIFTRVIADRNDRFDEIDEGYDGPLYLEVLSRTFPVKVTHDLCLSQIRFVRGRYQCSDAEVVSLYESEPLLYEGDSAISRGEVVLRGGLFLRVDLAGMGGTDCVGYKALKNRWVIDLNLIDHYDLLDFWEPVWRNSRGQLILEPDEFYLLTSREKIRVPPTHAAEMIAYDQASGELRTHYAGFFDPGFGYGPRGEVRGTVAVMEVRALDAPFMIEDGQRFCKLQIEKMASAPDRLYGDSAIASSYQFQGLTPSKHFRQRQVKDLKDIKERV